MPRCDRLAFQSEPDESERGLEVSVTTVEPSRFPAVYYIVKKSSAASLDLRGRKDSSRAVHA